MESQQNDSRDIVWAQLLLPEERQLYQLIQEARDALRNLFGLDGAIFFLDYCTTRSPKSFSITDALTYVRDMSPVNKISTRSIKNAFQHLSFIETEQKKFFHAVKYSLIDQVFHHIPVTVMNYGYSSDPNVDIRKEDMEREELPFRYGLQLYHALIDGAEIEDRDVLEVGCGNGGGAHWITRHYKPRSYIGIDQCFDHISFCSHKFTNSILSFRYGDAEDLPFETKSFDLVLNLESAHCYPNLPLFLKEVFRVLRSNGYCYIADFFNPKNVFKFITMIKTAGMELIYKKEITFFVESGVRKYIPQLLLLQDRVDSPELRNAYNRIITSRSFNEPQSNWRGQRLIYLILALKKRI